MKKDIIIVFTDGASRGNPGPGGWGAIVISPDNKVTELGGREAPTTNNRMELSGALHALAFIETKKLPGKIEIHTDSAYLLQGVTGWMYGWEKNGWKTKNGEDVLNQDLWKEIGALVFRLKQKHEIDWKKVSGHSGLVGNERVDVIATSAADEAQQLLFVGSLSAYEKIIGGSVFDSTPGVEKKKKTSSSIPAYSYVSLVGGLIMVHKTWPECENRVKGKSGVRFKKVFSKEEEASLIQEWTEAPLHSRD
ncbi:MAG: ribonuclease HI [Candidatus Pacebacteria bacterium]|nr:ribonuclease HI [Candidatus Paceibacterota bacterium]